jgi:hypothetical protein
VAADVPPNQTVDDWLAAYGQSRALCDWLWHPLAIAALNQLPSVAAAARIAREIGELFAPDPKAAALGLPAVPLDDLFATPAREFIEARGGAVLTKTRARVGWRIRRAEARRLRWCARLAKTRVRSRRGSQPAGPAGPAGPAVIAVRAGDALIETSCVISTVPWHALGRIWDAEPPAALSAISRTPPPWPARPSSPSTSGSSGRGFRDARRSSGS